MYNNGLRKQQQKAWDLKSDKLGSDASYIPS